MNIISKIRTRIINKLFSYLVKRGLVNQVSIDFISFLSFSKIKIDFVNKFFYDKSDKIKIFHFSRINRVFNYYSNGIFYRQQVLFKEYLLYNIEFDSKDIIIDCGANIGEVGYFLKDRYNVKEIISIEPDPTEYKILCKNLPNFINLNLGLFDINGTLDFYLNNNTADSSFFEESGLEVIKVEVVTLDMLFERCSIEKCKLFKLEAEGAEPEILMGGKKALQFIDYISVDCGPERGPNAQKTIAEVTEILCLNNFALIDINSVRTVLLFRNKININ
jgi:FkbM family methyltransferase